VRPSQTTLHLKGTTSNRRYVKSQHAFHEKELLGPNGELNTAHGAHPVKDGMIIPKRGGKGKKTKGAKSDLHMRTTAAYRGYEKQQKEYHCGKHNNGKHRRLSGAGGYLHNICTVNVTVPGPSAYQPDGGFSTLTLSGGKFNQSKTKTYIEQYVYDHRGIPGPMDRQPECGAFSTSISKRASAENASTGGRFNKDKSKDFLEQHIYDKRYVPAPTANQPEFGTFTTSIAHVTKATTNPASGRFAASKSKNFAEQQIYEKRFVPAPGECQPDGGWSSVENAGGGKFNQSASKNYIEQHIYDKKDVPDPSQPAFGKFHESIARRTSVTNSHTGGSFNTSRSKNYIEQHVYDKKDVPAPTAYNVKGMCMFLGKPTDAEFEARMKKGRPSFERKKERMRPASADATASSPIHSKHLVARPNAAFAGPVG
jgi:hypothetical protein